jgi:hypothetical protein
MNTKILLAAITIVVAFGIAAVIGPVTVPTPVIAQNMTGDNMTAMGGKYDWQQYVWRQYDNWLIDQTDS